MRAVLLSAIVALAVMAITLAATRALEPVFRVPPAQMCLDWHARYDVQLIVEDGQEPSLAYDKAPVCDQVQFAPSGAALDESEPPVQP